jgi:hypothetical protein
MPLRNCTLVRPAPIAHAASRMARCSLRAHLTLRCCTEDRHLQRGPAMRDPRYRFSDNVRSATRAIALRMIHAETVASSSEELHAWIMRTEDLREKLTIGGYGSDFSSDDLFPLFQSFVAKATAPVSRPKVASAWRVRWIVIAVVATVVAVLIVRVCT